MRTPDDELDIPPEPSADDLAWLASRLGELEPALTADQLEPALTADQLEPLPPHVDELPDGELERILLEREISLNRILAEIGDDIDGQDLERMRREGEAEITRILAELDDDPPGRPAA
jgi:hypothetical protein